MVNRPVGEVIAAAHRVAEISELDEVYLANCSLETHAESGTPPFDVETHLSVKAEVRESWFEAWTLHETRASMRVIEDEDGAPLDEGDVDERRVWTVVVESVARFELHEGADMPSREDAAAFALVVGASILHPYAREATQVLSGRSQFPAYTMGLMESVSALPDDHLIEMPDNP